MDEGRGRQNVVNPEIVMRLLVIAADGTEVALPGIREVLLYLGVPFTEYIATRTPGGLTPQFLANGNRGNFQGVILTSGSLAYFDPSRGWVSALTDAEWQALWAYQAAFGVRQVTWYTYPTPDYGFDTGGAVVNGSANPVDLTLTAAGRQTFSYLNPANPLPIRNVWNYRAPAIMTSTVTTLATDGAGNALMLTRQFPNGRENLAFTADGNAFILHTMALGYGIVNWVTRGLFIGERQVYVTAHMDDIFIDSAIFNPNDPNASYRITGNDLATVLAWQQASRQTYTQTQAFMFDMPFNGIGTQTGMYPNDTLTPFARQNSAQFRWINHTLTHRNLDGPPAAVIATEIRENINVANRLPLRNFTRVNMVTPEISGLRN
ncbi:MAG: hypothetical protein NZ518_11515, partial [Dehalococcoidia bacterium]|nr:hypothetical protein [Dehalococcoidia bacterium]